jgi:nucleotide-binding universal stress UspA family protein
MNNLFQHIMLPLDFTAKNTPAIEVALNLALQHKSRVSLLHVIETIELAADDDLTSFYKSLNQRANEKLAPYIQQFIDVGIPTKEQIILGKRAPEIVSFAQREEVDLVVLSSHRVNLNDPSSGWATLSYQVAILCLPCLAGQIT